MGHPLRLKILCLVGSEELSVFEVGDARVVKLIALMRAIFGRL